MAEDRKRKAGLDVAVTVLAAGAGILPIAGFLVREWAFSWGLHLDAVTPLALATSIGGLAWTGAGGLYLSAPAILLALLLIRVELVVSAFRRLSSVNQKLADDWGKFKSNYAE